MNNISDGASLKQIYRSNDCIIIDFAKYNNINSEQVYDNNDLIMSQPDIFMDISKLLQKNNLSIPTIYEYHDNVIKCQDLGDTRLFDICSSQSLSKKYMKYYDMSINWISNLQKINVNNILPRYYGFNSIRSELDNFVYCVLKKCGKINIDNIDILNDELERLSKEIYSQPQVIVHRDYQSKNIMVRNENIYVIDYQDMCIGPILHDIVSLLYDLNVCMNENDREMLERKYYDMIKNNWNISFSEYQQKIYQSALHRVMKSMTHRGKMYFKDNKYEIIGELKKGIYIINNIRNKLQGHNSLFYFLDKYLPTSLITIILAAGKGSRMKVNKPKVLCEISGRPMISYVIDQAKEILSDHIIIIVGYKKELVINEVNDNNIIYVTQEPQLGTGHAVMQTKDLLYSYKGDILVLMGDAPLISCVALNEIIKYHKSKNNISSIMTKNYNEPGCAKVIRDDDNNFIKTVECADIDNDNLRSISEVAVGVSIFDNEYLFDALTKVKNDNKQSEYYLPDVIKIQINEKLQVNAFMSNKINTVHSCNTMDALKSIENIINSV